MWHVWGGNKIHAGLWESLKKREHFDDLSVDERIILKNVSKK
jgi:hypothetical protein